MPKVKEVNGGRTTRSAGKTSAKAPAALPPVAKAKPIPARPGPIRPATARTEGRTATKVAATPAKTSPGLAAKTVARADGRTRDENRRGTTSKVKRKVGAKPARKAAPAARKGGKLPIGKAKPEPVRGVKIRELNPQEKCGPGTSVLQLFRVDESLGRELTTHLVFFDRHGWYCEHGRTCRAVADVQKLGKRMVVGL